MKFILEEIAYDPNSFLKLKGAAPWVKKIQIFLVDWFSRENNITVNTSGSTGIPTAIRIPKASINKSAEITNRYFDLNPGKVGLLCLPITYIAGKMMVIRALEGNWNLVLEEPSSCPLQKVNQEIDFVAMTPHQVECIIQEFPERLNDVKQMIIGGGAVSTALRKQLQGVNPICFQTYGMTETITHIALQQLNLKNQKDYFTALEEFLLDLDDRGCLVIEANHIYQKKVITNDIVNLIDFNKFEWLGRIDNVINSGGIKISPEVVEETIKDLIDSPFFITGRPDKDLGEKTVLCIESPIWKEQKKEQILKQIESRLHKYEVPRSFLFFDCFLYTPTGKIQRSKTLVRAERE